MDQSDELGPIDYVVIEFPGSEINWELVPELRALVERGLVHLIDTVLVRKDRDGVVTSLEVSDAGGGNDRLSALVGDIPGLLSESDIDEVGAALAPDTSALFILWENSWAGPFAAATRRLGGQMVASGRVSVTSLLEAIEASDADETGAS